mmetsp:Transcript_65160/g.151326  ORF Transcript_65160/g.151326 Transcript_65160/m.151326 type:complete len:202 (-) Transcript_65160:364-969(-)
MGPTHGGHQELPQQPPRFGDHWSWPRVPVTASDRASPGMAGVLIKGGCHCTSAVVAHVPGGSSPFALACTGHGPGSASRKAAATDVRRRDAALRRGVQALRVVLEGAGVPERAGMRPLPPVPRRRDQGPQEGQEDRHAHGSRDAQGWHRRCACAWSCLPTGGSGALRPGVYGGPLRPELVVWRWPRLGAGAGCWLGVGDPG